MNQWHNCPNLAAFWYNTISALLYFYTLYTSGVRYRSFRDDMNNPRYGQDWNENYLLLYLGAILLASILWLVFVFSSIFKTGSLANDYVEMNTYRTIVGVPHITWSMSLVCRKIASRLRYHLVPFNSTIHLSGAFFLLIPIPLILEEKSKHDALKSGKNPVNYLLTTYTAELINFIVAAVSLTVRLPTVFLSASTQISIIFSCLLFISNSNFAINCIFHQLLPLGNIKCDILNTVVLDIVIFIFTVLNYGLVYEMARTRYLDLAYAKQDNFQDQISNKCAGTSVKRPKIVRFWSNILSSNVLIGTIALNIYQSRSLSSTVPLFFFYLVSTMLHYLSWLIVLLLFTFKIDWHFKPFLMAEKTDFYNRDTTLEILNQDLKGTETLYTCFQANDGIRSVSMGSSRTPNQDFSPTSSSSGSHTSERVASYKHVPSISKQLETLELTYDDSPSYRNVGRQPVNVLQDITEENSEQIGSFKSPNISQRSSNIHSSDSGIGTTYRTNPDYRVLMKSPGSDGSRFQPTDFQGGQTLHEYEISEDVMGTINIYSDV